MLVTGLLVVNLVVGMIVIVLLISGNRKNDGQALVQKLQELHIELAAYMQREREEKSLVRQEREAQNKSMREEVGNNLGRISAMISAQLTSLSESQSGQLARLSNGMNDLLKTNFEQQETIRQTLESRIKEMQSSNEHKLDQMRQTVDEKLNATLSTRLDASFKQVGDQLQLLYKSIGEMQSLAGGVHELNRVLTNVKARGTWGEVQLGSLLEQTMTAEQYAKNVATKKNSDARVEYAVKLPGKNDGEDFIWLPIDAKFSQEDYLKLLDASERADAQGVEEAAKALENRVKQDARTIHDKYISPPGTTDFSIMFLPTEGLYAEVLRRPGLAEFCQTHYRVMLAGPTTLTALLNSLRMGFETLAIEKKSSEVWKLLRAVKSQYTTFNGLLDKSLKKINEAHTSMEHVKSRSELIQRKLGKIEELDIHDAENVLGIEQGKTGL